MGGRGTKPSSSGRSGRAAKPGAQRQLTARKPVPVACRPWPGWLDNQGRLNRRAFLTALRCPNSILPHLLTHDLAGFICLEISARISQNAGVIQPGGNQSRPPAADGAMMLLGGAWRPGGAPGLQNQCGAQQSPGWVRFPCTSAPNKGSKMAGS